MWQQDPKIPYPAGTQADSSGTLVVGRGNGWNCSHPSIISKTWPWTWRGKQRWPGRQTVLRPSKIEAQVWNLDGWSGSQSNQKSLESYLGGLVIRNPPVITKRKVVYGLVLVTWLDKLGLVMQGPKNTPTRWCPPVMWTLGQKNPTSSINISHSGHSEWHWSYVHPNWTLT